jgi:cytochrome c-type biogenesis protein
VETRIYDMMKDREKHAAVFNLFQPAVVPIQLYINPEGEVVNVFYDEHTRGELESALQCIDPSRDGTACLVLAKKDAGTEASWEKDFEKQVNQSLASGSLMIIVLAFIAGIASSFFPCTVAMLPVLVGYMGGYSGGSKKDIFLQVTMFVLGLATVMTVLGVGLSLLGATFGSQNSNLLYYAVGGLCIVMALQMMELVHIPLPQTIKTLPETQQGKLTTFYVLGCAFGLVASPCGTPVLAAILGVIGKEGNVLLGGTSLFSYALGQGALLMVAGLFTGLLKHRATFMKVGTALTKVSGVLILLVGASFILQAAGLWSPLLKALNLGE